MHIPLSGLILAVSLHPVAVPAAARQGAVLPPVPTPTDVKPGSITCDECPYPYPSKYLDIRAPHLESPDKVVPPLVAFLKEGLAAK